MINHKHPLVWYVAAGYGLPAGIEAHILHYATEMRGHGFETRVVVFYDLPKPEHRFLKALRERNIPILSLNASDKPMAFFKGCVLFIPWFFYTILIKRIIPNIFFFINWIIGRESVRRMKKLLIEETPDIIHIFGRLRTDAWREFLPRRTIFHEMMTGTVDKNWTESELSDFRRFAEKIAYFFTPGNGVADNVKREFGIKRNIDTIFTMCPDELEGGTYYIKRSQSVSFGVICRLTSQKGISYLLDAIKQFRDKHGNVEFTFAGAGDLEEDILAFCRTNNLNDVRVIRVNNVPEILKNIDIFVHPSIDDAMPVSIAEALMCGCPCIVCRVGGCPDLVRDGVEGFVIESRKVDQILDRMERFKFMSNPEFEGFRKRARLRYEEVCLPESVGDTVEKYYRNILKGNI